MRNKKFSWIMLPVVLGIWGIIGWKVYEAMKDNSPDEIPRSIEDLVSEKPEVPDTYKLFLDYPDPFLTATKPAPKKSSNGNSQAPKQIIPKTEPVAVVWPEIQYAGLVKSPKDGKMVGFLNVAGVSHLVKNGDVVGIITVKNIWRDSVEVLMGKEKRMIRK